ncbi:hypothetical protein [Streptomyces sp. NRRL F-2664]|uniref:hypothetical protein n=1 Tax=Streptomyces sp. NRRL F-2664 TaxID=1463842 RepID=UPI00131DD946|nr:hypothetical protein [Streptomyces sp. NRRL F-2664]
MVGKVLTGHVRPAEASAGRVVCIDGKLATAWDWKSEGTSVFSGRHRGTGFSLPIAAAPAGDLPAPRAPLGPGFS